MAEKKRVPEGSLCDHCHDPKKPLTQANSAHIVSAHQRDSVGKKITAATAANVHREKCADAWIEAHPYESYESLPANHKTKTATR